MAGRRATRPVIAGRFGLGLRSRRYPTRTAVFKRTTAPPWKGKAGTTRLPPVVLKPKVTDVEAVLEVVTVVVELTLDSDDLEEFVDVDVMMVVETLEVVVFSLDVVEAVE